MKITHVTPLNAVGGTPFAGADSGVLNEYYSVESFSGTISIWKEIREWYGLEENACYEEYDQGRKRMPNNDFLHWQSGYFRALAGRTSLGKGFGIGHGNGEEFRPVRRWIEHLYIVESADGYFRMTRRRLTPRHKWTAVWNFPLVFSTPRSTSPCSITFPTSPTFWRVVPGLEAGRHLSGEGTHHDLGPWHRRARAADPLRTRVSPQITG